MRNPCLPAGLAALLAGGCSGGLPWQQELDGLPLHADEVVAAVSSLPECSAALARGGRIVWKPVVTCGSPAAVSGCSYPDANPPLVEVEYRQSAWDGPPSRPEVSTLAHELCHLCGYTDGVDYQRQADACAMRARAVAGR